MKKLCFVVLAVTLLSGCAFNTQTVNLRPVVSSPHSSEGRGISVAVHVVDDRGSTSLGHRGASFGPAAEITTNSDVTAIVSSKVSKALQDQGFIVVGSNDQAGARLTVEIRLLKYSTSTGFWTGGIQIEAALRAAANKSGRSYENMYRIKKEERVVIVPTADKNAEWINQALGDVITKLVTDKKLVQFFAG